MLLHHLQQFQLEWKKKWGGLFDVPPWPHWANDLLSALGALQPFPADPPPTPSPTWCMHATTHCQPPSRNSSTYFHTRPVKCTGFHQLLSEINTVVWMLFTSILLCMLHHGMACNGPILIVHTASMGPSGLAM